MHLLNHLGEMPDQRDSSGDVAVVRSSAKVFVLPADKIGRKRVQRVDPLARACGSDAPDLKAKAPKQTEKRVK